MTVSICCSKTSLGCYLGFWIGEDLRKIWTTLENPRWPFPVLFFFWVVKSRIIPRQRIWFIIQLLQPLKTGLFRVPCMCIYYTYIHIYNISQLSNQHGKQPGSTLSFPLLKKCLSKKISGHVSLFFLVISRQTLSQKAGQRATLRNDYLAPPFPPEIPPSQKENVHLPPIDFERFPTGHLEHQKKRFT